MAGELAVLASSERLLGRGDHQPTYSTPTSRVPLTLDHCVCGPCRSTIEGTSAAQVGVLDTDHATTNARGTMLAGRNHGDVVLGLASDFRLPWRRIDQVSPEILLSRWSSNPSGHERRTTRNPRVARLRPRGTTSSLHVCWRRPKRRRVGGTLRHRAPRARDEILVPRLHTSAIARGNETTRTTAGRCAIEGVGARLYGAVACDAAGGLSIPYISTE